MSIKLKALGLGLLAALAVSAVAVMNASAETSLTGHFTSEVAHTTLQVTEGPEEKVHRLELTVEGFTGIVCDKPTYTSTISEATVTELTVEAKYEACHTTGGTPGEVNVTMNGCDYRFTQPNKESAKTEHTVDLVCPVGAHVVVDHEGCEITIDPENPRSGIGYTTTVENNIHSITLTANVTGFKATLHTGLCVLIGTTKNGSLTGSATVKGLDTEGHQVGITATGSKS